MRQIKVNRSIIMPTYRSYLPLLLLVLFGISLPLWAANGKNKIKVMTYNQYIGADLKPILETISRNDFNDELVAALQGMTANRFQDRVQRQAAIIVREKPDVVALQEVWRFQCKDLSPALPKQGCNNPSIAGAFVDFLDELLVALNSQGVPYRAVSRVQNLDLAALSESGFPSGIRFDISGSEAILNGVDRGVILVRSDIPARAVNFKSACPGRVSFNGCTYDLLLSTATPLGTLTIPHGFSGADVRIGQKIYRIVNTHLEQRDPFRFIQADQADELINTLKLTTPSNRTLLVLGDLNSSPNDDELPGITPPFQQFIDKGYTDAWKFRRPVTPGYTCCQAESLLNKGSNLRNRIDFIFSRRNISKGSVRLVGSKQSDKTPQPKLWPSDHAGIVAELQY
jgi:endonuclease/exonuclease/phosphatase family metal-dependent hydrolase